MRTILNLRIGSHAVVRQVVCRVRQLRRGR